MQHGVTALIEPISVIPGYFLKHQDQGQPLPSSAPSHAWFDLCSSPQPARGILEEVNSPNLRLLMDIFHAQRMDGSIVQRLADNMAIIGRLSADCAMVAIATCTLLCRWGELDPLCM